MKRYRDEKIGSRVWYFPWAFREGVSLSSKVKGRLRPDLVRERARLICGRRVCSAEGTAHAKDLSEVGAGEWSKRAHSARR